MKKYAITTLMYLGAVLTTAAQIPNASFELSNPDSSLAYWQAPAIAITIGDSLVFNGPLMEQFSESVEGNFCLSMRNAYDFTQDYGIAGGAYANKNALATSSFESHFSITDRPDSFVFYYKYKVNEGDSGSCTVEILDENLIEIGRAYTEIQGIATGFRKLSIPVQYQSSAQGAYARIYFRNGLSQPKFTTHLLIDELSFIYNNPTHIANNENTNSKITIYPNPAKGKINIKATIPITGISLMNTNGTILRQYTGQEQPDLTELPYGIYFLRIRSTTGTITKTIRKY